MIVASELQIGDSFLGHKVAALDRFGGFTYIHVKIGREDFTAKCRDATLVPETAVVTVATIEHDQTPLYHSDN
jgi:hypothetical protein